MCAVTVWSITLFYGMVTFFWSQYLKFYIFLIVQILFKHVFYEVQLTTPSPDTSIQLQTTQKQSCKCFCACQQCLKGGPLTALFHYSISDDLGSSQIPCPSDRQFKGAASQPTRRGQTTGVNANQTSSREGGVVFLACWLEGLTDTRV